MAIPREYKMSESAVFRYTRMKIQVRERGYAIYQEEVESLEEVEGFDVYRAVHADPKVYGLRDTFNGKNLICLVDETSEIALVILEE